MARLNYDYKMIARTPRLNAEYSNIKTILPHKNTETANSVILTLHALYL